MDPHVELNLKIAAVLLMALLIVVIVVVSSGGTCDEAAGASGRAAVHAADVENALGDATLMTYEQATAGKEDKGKGERCAFCLSEYGEGGAGELVRVVPACGHFYHAGCGVDRWLRKSRSCPICRGGLGPPPSPPLPGLPRPECPPMPSR